MKKIIYFLLVFLNGACTNKALENKSSVESEKTSSKHVVYEQVFYQIDSLLKIDNGGFWNYKLNGPNYLLAQIQGNL